MPAPADLSQGGFRLLQRTWLAALFLIGLGYLVLIPPFQAVDEVAHWDRIWTVAQGQYNCRKMPVAAAQFANDNMRFDMGPWRGRVPWSIFREMWEHQGAPGELWVATNACHYPPTAYIPAALAIRMLTQGTPIEPRPHKMFIAHYGARLVNWLLFFGCLVAALRLGRAPMPAVLFTTIPMVVHQAVSINNDAFQFGGVLLTAAILTRPATRARVWTAIAIIALMSSIKPINVIAAPLLWITLYTSARGNRWRSAEVLATAVAAVALPVATWLLWNHTAHVPILGTSTGMPVLNVDAHAQLELLRVDPLRVLRMLGWQLTQVFTAAPINGGWRGLLLALGWYRYEAPTHVYVLGLAALALGAPLLRWRSSVERPAPFLLVAGVIGAAVAYFVMVTLILHLEFTPVGAELVFGVQGRYFLYPLVILLYLPALASTKPTWLHGRSAIVVGWIWLTLSVATHVSALFAIRDLFWEL